MHSPASGVDLRLSIERAITSNTSDDDEPIEAEYLSEATLHPFQKYHTELKLSPLRYRVAGIVYSQSFETTLGIIIMFNVFLAVLETDADAADRQLPVWVCVTSVLRSKGRFSTSAIYDSYGSRF